MSGGEGVSIGTGMGVARQLRQIARFATLGRYIDAHLDDELTLAELADVACMSRHRLDGNFYEYAQETPMSRVWRLRLLRARQQIMATPERSLLDVAVDAGYASGQAFSRAFSRLHGKTPSACRDDKPLAAPPMRIETLPDMLVQHIPYSGPVAEFGKASNELRARAMSRGIARHRRFGWAMDVETKLYAGSSAAHITTKAALLDAPLGERIPGLDLDRLEGRHYAVFRFEHGMHVAAAAVLTTRVEGAGWQVVEGAWLRRCRNATYLPSRLESYFELYLPVAPRDRQRHRPKGFVLEK
jgi:AraC-like DNA-binding protein